MGGFRNFAISFTIISILAGCLTSYFVAFERGGPVAVTWGWLLIGLMSTIIALSMAEIASAYPTAGGLYYWASKLGSPGWGWATGWFNLIGQVAVTAAIGYGLATFATILVRLLVRVHDEDERLVRRVGELLDLRHVRDLFLTLAVLINLLDIRITSGLNMISAWWHMARRRVHRRRPHHRPRPASVTLVRLHGDGQRVRLRQRDDVLVEPGDVVRVRARAPDGAVHDHGLRRVGAHGRGNEGRVAHGRNRHVDVGLRRPPSSASSCSSR